MADGKHKGDPLYVRIKQAHVDSLNILRDVVKMTVRLQLIDRKDAKKQYNLISKQTWDGQGIYFHSRLKHKGY